MTSFSQPSCHQLQRLLRLALLQLYSTGRKSRLAELGKSEISFQYQITREHTCKTVSLIIIIENTNRSIFDV